MAKKNHEIFTEDTVSRSYTTQNLACLRNDLTYLHAKDLGEGMYVYTHNLHIYIYIYVCVCVCVCVCMCVCVHN